MSYIGTFLTRPSVGSLVGALTAERGPAVERGIPYGTHARNRLDVYFPHAAREPAPIILFLYGGGWTSGAREMYGFAGAALAARGFVTVIPDYRLYPEVTYPDFMADTAHAYLWAQTYLARSGTGDAPLFIMGHSAGAHIGALLAYDRTYITEIGGNSGLISGFIGLSGPYGYDPTTHERSRKVFSNAESAAQVQPVEQVSAPAPPALLMHGSNDTVVKVLNAHRMRQALESAGSTARVIEFKNAGHTDLMVALSRLYRWRVPVLEQIAAFIDA